MGDRAVLIFTDYDDSKYCPAKPGYSTSIYMHSQGSTMLYMLDNALPRLIKGHILNLPFLFYLFCHTSVDGYVGLGSFNAPTQADIDNNFKDLDPGDNGVFLLNISNRVLTQYLDGEVILQKTIGTYLVPD